MKAKGHQGNVDLLMTLHAAGNTRINMDYGNKY